MSVKLNVKSDLLINGDQSKVHLLPFHIDFDGEANVSKYFTSYVKEVINDEGLEASFRGLPLKGKTVALPEGYKGLLFTETNKHLVEDEERNMFLKNTFTNMTYWNYDKVPSSNDAVISALDWIDISNAIHSEDNEEETTQIKTEDSS